MLGMLASEIQGVHALDVFLNGKRNYVQGSQILARTAEIIQGRYGAGLCLREFAFKHTTVKLVGVHFGEGEQDMSASRIGEATFGAASNGIRTGYFELSELAPKADIPESIVLNLKSGGTGGSGCFQYAGALTFEDALRVVVQAIKTLHQALAPDAYDIWLTGMRGGAIPLDRGFSAEMGEIEVEMLRLMGSPPQYQTLNRVTVRSQGSALAPFAVTFALRSDRGVNVH
jgi:hypothetical protein